MIGKSISHYKILEKLGEGGMGVVYKAEDTKLKREVAIKFLPRRIDVSDEERQRFKLEAQAAAALNHNNIAAARQLIYNFYANCTGFFVLNKNTPRLCSMLKK